MARALRYAVRIRRFPHQEALAAAVREHCDGSIFAGAAHAALGDASSLIPADVAAAATIADKEAAALKAEQDAALKAKAKREAEEKKKEAAEKKEKENSRKGKGASGAASGAGSSEQADMEDGADAASAEATEEKKSPFTDASKNERAAYVLYLLAAICSQHGEISKAG